MASNRLLVIVLAVVFLIICAGSPAVVGEGKGPSRLSSHLRASSDSATDSLFKKVTKQKSDQDSLNALRVTSLSDETQTQPKLKLEDPSRSIDIPSQAPLDFTEKILLSDTHKIEATIINPFRSATMSAEVGGIIEEYKFETGDLVQQGATILRISKKRYDLAVQKANQNLQSLQLALKRAQKDKDIKESLFSRDASSLQDLLKAEAEVEIIEQRIGEGEIVLKQALLDLDACQVKAPFTGYLALRYKEPFEAVAPLEKIFAFIDSNKVYAVAYVPETLMEYFKNGAKAVFSDSHGRSFVGEVDKIEPVMDPKTSSQKVYVLVDNAKEHLKVGMTGSLESMR